VCFNEERFRLRPEKEECAVETLRETMRHAKLTKTSRIIGEYILDHETDACFMTSTEIAAQLQVSEASVIRFARALGFSGYMDFQKQLRRSHTERLGRISSAVAVPYERLQASMAHSDENYIQEFLMNTETNIASVIRNNPQEVFDSAIDLLLGARRKYIVASRANTGVASYFNLLLRHQLPDVIPTWESSVNVIDHMCDIGPEDCVILFSFPRYSEMDRQALQLAEDAGASSIVVTDRPSAPMAAFAKVLLTVDVDTNTFFNSYVGVQLVMEILSAGLSRRVGDAAAEKLQRIDRYIGTLGVY
jgi:DNA-binding MurR/RpiR family transcriptional regulator